jgi:hypothetical protein
MLLSVGILAAVLAFGLAAAVGRRLSGRGAAGASGDRTGPLELLRQVFSRLGDAVGRFRFVAVQGGLTTLQILLFAGTPVLLLRALEIPTPSAWLAGTGVMAISSLAGILLPPSYGAGPAAASVFVLGAMGVSAESSMAFATLLWVNASVLPVALGLVPAWRRIGVLRAVAEGRAEEGVTPRR